MSSALLHQHPLPAREAARQAPPPVSRLTGAQLREISAQWRQRVDEDPEKTRRIADALEWLAAHRDAAHRPPSLIERLRASLAGWIRH